MRALIKVIDTGSFSEAARQLRIGQPAVSKAIRQLERELDVPLLSRTTRGLSATDAGQRFYERAIRAIDEADEAEIAARGAGAALRGTLRVSLAVTFGRLHVVPLLPAFLAMHPQLELDLLMEDRASDLVGESIDVALRLGPQPDSSLPGRVIASARRVVVATPDYVSRTKLPRHPSDLEQHQAVIMSIERGPSTWTFVRDGGSVEVTPRGRLRVSAAEGLRAAVLAGIGYTIGSEWGFGRELADGRVVELLKDWSLGPTELWALFPNGRQPSARARAFVDYLSTRLE